MSTTTAGSIVPKALIFFAASAESGCRRETVRVRWSAGRRRAPTLLGRAPANPARGPASLALERCSQHLWRLPALHPPSPTRRDEGNREKGGARALRKAGKGNIAAVASLRARADSHAAQLAPVIEALKSGKIGYLGLDVYEEEEQIFFEDRSGLILSDDVFARLLTFPNVIITGHQAFFTREALLNIAATTIDNIIRFENNQPLEKLGRLIPMEAEAGASR